MNSPSLIFVLVEDRRQKQLLYGFLVTTGVEAHQIIFDVSPSARGSAEQWVRENFARNAGKCRARNAHASTGMFVMLDADTRTVQERLNALDEALVSAGQLPVSRVRDPIARLIPKRNVETWIHFLSTNGFSDPPVNEQEDYKWAKTPDEWSKMIPLASETLSMWTRKAAALPDNLLDSLRIALEEIPRAIPAER